MRPPQVADLFSCFFFRDGLLLAVLPFAEGASDESGPVHPGPYMTEYSMYFVSVMEWVLHSDNLLCLTVWLKKLAHMILFLFQLFLIRHVQELTSTAFSMYRTE